MARGGARVGAGRKPKALVYGADITAAESRIVEALPKLIDKLMELAMEGNVWALKYLVDRILGRVPALAAAPAADTSLRYVEKDFQSDLVGHLLRAQVRKEDRDLRMSEMDLEGTELEYEFEAEEEGDEKEGGIDMDVQDGQDEEEEDGEEESGELRMENEELKKDGRDGEEEENLTLTLSLERRGDQTVSTTGDVDVEEGREIDTDEQGAKGTGDAPRAAPEGPASLKGRWLPPSGRMGFAI